MHDYLRFKAVFLLFLMFVPIILTAQKEAANWYFGDHAGISFNTEPPVATMNNAMNANYGCATISDKNGNLLFYTNSDTVWNKNHVIMPNGTGLGGEPQMYQNSIIIPQPGNSNIYYIFTINGKPNYGSGYPRRLSYSIVNISLNGGLGIVTSKNNTLQTGVEKLTAVKHKNGEDIWVITHGISPGVGSNTFYSYLVTQTGIASAVTSQSGHNVINFFTYGQLKASPDGSKLAIAMGAFGVVQQYFRYFCELNDFNDSTGIVSNPLTIRDSNYLCISLEFSPNSKNLYCDCLRSPYSTPPISYPYWLYDTIYQFDISSNIFSNILNSCYSMGMGTGITNYGMTQLQLAINGKIYFAQYKNINQTTGVISAPNESGSNCGFSFSGLYLNGRLFNREFPNFIQSYFYEPTFNISGNCANDTLFFTLRDSNNAVSVEWNFGDTNSLFNTSTLKNPNHFYSNPGNYIVSITINKLTDTVFVRKNIIIEAKPVPNFGVNDPGQCLSGNFFNFTNTSSNCNNCSMAWNFGDNKSSILASPTHQYTSSGFFDIKLVAVSKHNCIDSITKRVFVNPSPLANFIIDEDTQCLKTNITFNNKSTIINGKLDSLLWNMGDGNFTNTDTVHHIYSAPGTYKVQLWIQSDSGCTDTISHLVVAYPVPLASFYVNDTTQCINGNSYTFNNTTVLSQLQPQNSTSYKWYFGDGITDSFVNPSHSYLKADTFQSRLIAIVDNNCRDTFDQEIFVYDLPIADFVINDTDQCLMGNSFAFTNKSTIKSSTFSQKWEFGDGIDKVSFNTSHSYSIADSFWIKLLIISDSGCKDSISKKVVIHPDQITNYSTSDTSVCIGELIQFNNSSSYNYGILTFNWDFGDGNSTGTQNPQHSYSADSNFDVKLVSINNFGCRDSIFHKVYVNPSPKTDFTINDTSQCLQGNSFTFTNNSSIKSGSIIQNYFDLGDGSNSLLSPVTHNYAIADTFFVTLSSKSDQGCTDSLAKTIYVRPMPTAGFTINSKSQNLAGNNFIFTSSAIIPSGNLKYFWDFGDSDTSTAINPAHSYTLADSYKVKMIATSDFGCADTFTDSVFVLRNPGIVVSFTMQNACVGDEVLFKNISTVISPDSFLNFLWDFGDGATIVLKEPKHIYTSAGKYIISLAILTALGFKDTLIDTIEIFADPVVNISASPDTIVIPGSPVTLSASGLYDQLLWFNNSTSGSVNVTSEGTYWVTASYNNGCKSADTIILIKGEIKKPEFINVITPNGDGINDYLVVRNIDLIIPCKLSIYNRWGDELFSTIDYQNNWDGTYKGKKLPEGTYYYVLVAKSGKVFRGAVNILK